MVSPARCAPSLSGGRRWSASPPAGTEQRRRPAATVASPPEVSSPPAKRRLASTSPPAVLSEPRRLSELHQTVVKQEKLEASDDYEWGSSSGLEQMIFRPQQCPRGGSNRLTGRPGV